MILLSSVGEQVSANWDQLWDQLVGQISSRGMSGLGIFQLGLVLEYIELIWGAVFVFVAITEKY